MMQLLFFPKSWVWKKAEVGLLQHVRYYYWSLGPVYLRQNSKDNSIKGEHNFFVVILIIPQATQIKIKKAR
jgi:hypothetical protein